MTPPPPSPPAAKKSNVLLWILVGIGGFVALIVIAALAGGLFLVHKAKQAGVDPDLMRRNPALAATKLMTAMNPDVEFVSVDEGKQEILLREKKTGNTYTISYDDARRGHFQVKSPDDTIQIGGDAKVPTWVPDYPGSNRQGAHTARAKDWQSGTFTFKTHDSADRVAKYYRDEFQSTGFNVTVMHGRMLTAQDDVNKYVVVVMIDVDDNETSVTVTYSKNK